MVYYICETETKNEGAGGKAPRDIECICERLGFKPIIFPHRASVSARKLEKARVIIRCVMAWMRALKILNKDDILIYQHPMSFMMFSIKILYFLNRKKIKIIAFVHDLNFIRNKGGDASISKLKLYKKSDDTLKIFDYVICHNKKMKELLIKDGFARKQLVILEIFDYLCEDNQKSGMLSKSVTIAGNLSPGKSGYVYKMVQKEITYRLNLFGPFFNSEIKNKSINYMGKFEADELPAKLIGDFGIVWDGPQVDECAGNMGNYMRFNNPHKLSLYLASNMPVLVWRKAAVADFVLEHKIGLVIDSLDQISTILETLRYTEYEILQKNAAKIGAKVRKGFYTEKALRFVMEIKCPLVGANDEK